MIEIIKQIKGKYFIKLDKYNISNNIYFLSIFEQDNIINIFNKQEFIIHLQKIEFTYKILKNIIVFTLLIILQSNKEWNLIERK